MKKSVLNRIVSELLSRSGSGVAVKMESYFPGGRLIGGKYAMNTHSVTMYTEVIKQQCLQLFGSLEPVYDYFAVVFAHELGHAADLSLGKLCDEMENTADERKRKEIALQIEENAWNNAMPWMLDVDPAFINVIIDRSLEAYREVLAPVTA
ncbi:hypothetical protein [Paenibacillus sp. DMB20]|uniref:hypothetical protein n=1 Tax=Paenibacillus sp. DMB20 TaxID=1642570 RepID=UPI0006278326|nr:hypothetical protein [Paenibacillus sp. DMB20]KKO54692.1 hypothetical protein XI25_05185 [Paenibacillus sp. DMB20]